MKLDFCQPNSSKRACSSVETSARSGKLSGNSTAQRIRPRVNCFIAYFWLTVLAVASCRPRPARKTAPRYCGDRLSPGRQFSFARSKDPEVSGAANIERVTCDGGRGADAFTELVHGDDVEFVASTQHGESSR